MHSNGHVLANVDWQMQEGIDIIPDCLQAPRRFRVWYWSVLLPLHPAHSPSLSLLETSLGNCQRRSPAGLCRRPPNWVTRTSMFPVDAYRWRKKSQSGHTMKTMIQSCYRINGRAKQLAWLFFFWFWKKYVLLRRLEMFNVAENIRWNRTKWRDLFVQHVQCSDHYEQLRHLCYRST